MEIRLNMDFSYSWWGISPEPIFFILSSNTTQEREKRESRKNPNPQSTGSEDPKPCSIGNDDHRNEDHDEHFEHASFADREMVRFA